MREALDPVTVEVVRNRLQHLTREMAGAIVKTAVSPLISEARDFSCILYDAAGRIVATAATVPFHFGVCAGSIAAVLARFGKAIAPGDVFLANDPHDGGGLHLQDVVVMRPIFRGRTRIGELPRGEYSAQGWVEFDEEAFLVRCTLRVGDGELLFDYTGSAPECPYFFNSKPEIVRSELVVRVHQILAADVPFTDGILQAVRVVAPEGSIVNARPPAPIAAAHMHVGLMAMELGETCLKQAIACSLGGGRLAERVTAPGGTTGLGLSSWHGTASFLVMDGNAVGAG